jgi:hypothetical protein
VPEEPEARAAALRALQADPRLTLGAARGDKLAVVAETDGPVEDARLFDALCALPGVHVDLVRYDFDDVASVDALPARRRRVGAPP